MRKATKTESYNPTVGMRGTTSGFPATIVRVCEWSRQPCGSVMIEVRTPGGISCITHEDFIPTEQLARQLGDGGFNQRTEEQRS